MKQTNRRLTTVGTLLFLALCSLVLLRPEHRTDTAAVSSLEPAPALVSPALAELRGREKTSRLEAGPDAKVSAQPGMVSAPPSFQAGEAAFASLAEWVQRYQEETDPAARAAMEAEGMERAQQRRAALYSLIQTDPERALQLALPARVRRQLPASVQGLLEEQVSGRGDFAVIGVYPLPGQEREVAPVYRETTIGGVKYRTFVYGRRADHPTHPNLPLHGIALSEGENRVLALDQNAVVLLGPEEAGLLSGPEMAGAVCALDGQPVAAAPEPLAAAVGDERVWLCSHAHAEELNAELLAEAGEPGGGSGGALAESPYTDGRKRIILFRWHFRTCRNRR